MHAGGYARLAAHWLLGSIADLGTAQPPDPTPLAGIDGGTGKRVPAQP